MLHVAAMIILVKCHIAPLSLPLENRLSSVMLRLTALAGAMYNCTAYKFSKLALVTSIADTVKSQMLEGDHLIMFSMFLH